MPLASSGRLRVSAFLCALGVGALGACSSSDSGGGDGGPVDSGGPDRGSTDAPAGDTTGDAGHDVVVPPPFDASGIDAGNPDAPYSFDGFAHPDGFSDADYCPDDDGDGFTVCGGDCNDHDSLINPCAFDTNAQSGNPVGMDGKDNDCDGAVDNLRLCDGALAASHDTNAADYASAVDACNNAACTLVVGATWYGPNNAVAHRVTSHMGQHFTPHQGAMMAFLSNGVADDDTDTPSYRPGDGTDLQNTFVNPYPLTVAQNQNLCGTVTQNETPNTPAVHDYSELRLTLRAPINAGSFTFDFNFFSEEYPVYVCQGFNDHFLAMLTSQQYPTGFQIAFDPNGHAIDVNNSFFQDCANVLATDGLGYTYSGCVNPLSQLALTGYEIPYCCSGLTNGNDNHGSGATDWLKTTAPIKPGEVFTLSFIVFDESDGILDSAVNVDNFRWNSSTLGSPVTGR